MNRVVVILLTILTSFFVFFGFRLTGIGNYSWGIATVSLFLMFLFRWNRDHALSPSIEKWIHSAVFINMGLFSLMLPQILVRDLIFVPLNLVYPNEYGFAFSGTVTLMMASLSTLLLIYGFWNVNRGPALVEVQVPIVGLEPDLENYTIVQVSDLHAGPGIGKQFVDRVVEKVMSLKTDIIVLTGDIADGKFDRFKDRVESLSKLSSHCPTLYITGNHEYYKDSHQWTNEFKKLGATILLNAHFVVTKGVNKILFVGVTDPAAKNFDALNAPDLQKAMLNAPLNLRKVLLAHQPDIAPSVCEIFDLQLSGHTHGGQFFPWTLVIRLFQPFTKGLKKCGSMWVYTNTGTGFWGPPFRIGTRSEITRLVLIKA